MIGEIITKDDREEICGIRYETTTIPRIGENISLLKQGTWEVTGVDHWIAPSGSCNKQKLAHVFVAKI